MKDVSIGTTLSELRKKNAMSQRELSMKLAVHITTIKNWESGSCYPDAKNICALAELFHVTTDFLLGREQKDTISLQGLTLQERKQLTYIIQAYMDTRVKY